MLAKINSGALVGLDAVPIEVEVDIASQGLPSFTIVGLPDKAVEEAKERVRAAIKNSGADFPDKRITVNLAPADLPKEGASYDLPIALGILVASGQLREVPINSLFCAELALNGALRHTNGILSQSIMAKNLQMKNFFLPEIDAKEAAIIKDVTIYPVPTLLSLFHHISGTKILPEQPHTLLSDYYKDEKYAFDMSDIRGQEKAKRVIEIAAAGGHNILLSGPPGAGKTLLARTLPSILPHLTLDEVLEVTKIYSISGLLEKSAILANRPFRAPHHTTSHIGLIGGSANPHPGEISLAHRGVLFLDEFPEFPRLVLEALRQPLEDGIITISRANGRVTFPAKFMLLAAQNPCPCGYFGDPTHQCSCQPGQILRYQKKISGPLLDRIDIHLNVPAVKVDKLTTQEKNQAESSSEIRQRVQKARDIQAARFTKISIKSNAEMTQKEIKTYCHLSEEAARIMRTAVIRMNLSARSYYRILKVARTIADLAGEKNIATDHVAEALQYRPRPKSLQ